MSKKFVLHDTIDGEMVEVNSVKDARDYVKESYTEGGTMHPDFSSFDVYEKVGEVFVQENDNHEATGIGYLIIDEGLEVQARVNFKLDELLIAMRNASARNWTIGFKMMDQKHTHYWEAFEEMVKMLEKERYMALPYDEVVIQNKRFKRNAAVEDILKIISPLVRGRNDRSLESITRAVVSIVEKAQKY